MTLVSSAPAETPDLVPVEGQPLAAGVSRLLEALRLLGAPLPAATLEPLEPALRSADPEAIQKLLDPHVLLVVQLNPESRVKVLRGPAAAVLEQGGYTAHLVKVVNLSTVSKELHITSPQAGQLYAGVSRLSAERMERLQLGEAEVKEADGRRFLEVSLHTAPPMAPELSGLRLEYAIALLYSRDSGRLEATIGFDVGQAKQEPGFRGEIPLLLEVRPAVRVKLKIQDHDGRPAAARLVFSDAASHVFPPQPKRLAPDFYFQEQIYRRDGDTVLLPAGKLTLRSSRGPEYRVTSRAVEIPRAATAELAVKLERWIDPREHGFYSGDHHIHGAGCAHYSSPTEGVRPEDMLLQVEGEGLNVGCVLTWGPCFSYQRRFFSPGVNELSTPFTLLKYDLEVSGFGSEALGHVCLLNLRDQVYPGSEGTKERGWPRWTTPVMRWAKGQGGFAGYAHSGSGLEIDPRSGSRRLLEELDADRDGLLTPAEAARGLLPEPFEAIDLDRDGALSGAELLASLERVADRLPNLAVPEMNGVGAMEVCVSTAAGVCDFMSAMDTPRIAEWNMWYHLLDCGFPLKVSGETDFPCMSGDRVGQGRVYVRLGKVERVDFAAWCAGLAAGRSYVSDGFAHALEFEVAGASPGDPPVRLERAGRVPVRAQVAFAPETPLTVAQGLRAAPLGNRVQGDTVHRHGSRTGEVVRGGTRLVELVVNGRPAASSQVPADGTLHEIGFEIEVRESSWIALRQFPQLHTNPVEVLVAGRPIRASRKSALWCIETIRQLWRARGETIPAAERPAAKAAFDAAIERYRRIAAEAPEGS
jgi:hypothetical protein